MKSLITSIFLLCAFTFCYSQEYTPFNFKNGIWICSNSLKNDITRPYDFFKNQYFTKGDTIINDTVFQKLYVYGYNEAIFDSKEGYFYYYNYLGAIANDSAKKIVRMIYSNKEKSEILYDFNLEIGDTIKNGIGANKNLVVISIDSIEYCGNYHKAYELNDTSEVIDQALIEGIGFNSGLINPIFFPYENSSSLICYSEKNVSCAECSLLNDPEEYFPMIADSNSWYITSCFEACGTDKYRLDGDTVIDQFTYLKYYDPNVIFGLLREDFNSKRIYFKGLKDYFKRDTSEILLYDFDLKTGDSILWIIPKIVFDYSVNDEDFYKGIIDTLGWIHLESITHKKIKGKIRPQLNFKSKHIIVSWIEGLGAIEYINNGSLVKLNCFYEGDILEYKFNNEIDCDYISDEVKETMFDKELNIFPNPTNGMIFIKLSDDIKNFKTSVYSLSGIKLRSSSGTPILNLSDLKNGIYIIEIKSGDKIYKKKVILK